MPATSLDLSQIKTDALSSASSFRSLIGLGTLATQSATITDYLTIASAASTYQPLDSDLTSIAALSTTAFGRGLLTEASATTARTTLGLGTLATQSPTGTPSASTFLRGDFSWQTIDLSGYVPYTGATGAVNLGSNAFTASQATLSAGTLNGTVLDIAQTWGGTGTYTGIKYNVTDSGPANAASLLMDLQVGGSSRVSISKNAGLSITGVNSVGSNLLAVRRASTANPGSLFRCVSDAIYDNSGFVTFFDEWSIEKWGDSYYWSSVQSSLYRQWMVSVYNNKIKLNQNTSLEWYGADYRADTNTSDLVLRRDAANTLAQRNTTNAQTFRVYNTFTDSSNYERAKIAWESNVLVIGTEKAGTGSARALELQTDGTKRLTIGTNGAVSCVAGFTAGGSVYIGNVHYMGAANRALLHSPADKIWCLSSNNGINDDFNRLQFGGTTSSFPAIKRNAAALNFRLADDSADCDITAKAATFSGNVTVSAVNLVTDTTTGTKIGTATTQKLGFFNATPVVQPTAVADATDAASVITQLNALLSRMRDLGLIAT